MDTFRSCSYTGKHSEWDTVLIKTGDWKSSWFGQKRSIDYKCIKCQKMFTRTERRSKRDGEFVPDLHVCQKPNHFFTK